MISLRTEMKKLCIILALACSVTTSTHAVGAGDSSATRRRRRLSRLPRLPGNGPPPGWQLYHGLISRGKIVGNKPWQ